jgi:hypothetical protein
MEGCVKDTTRKALLGIGVAVLALTPVFAVTYSRARAAAQMDERRAHGLDGKRARVAGNCVGLLRDIGDVSRRQIVGESFNLSCRLQAKEDESCDAEVSVLASAFDVSPKEPRKIAIARDEVQLWWNLTPKYPGDQTLLVTVLNEQHSLGFVVREAKLLPDWAGLVASAVCFLFGPILTVPFWVDRIEKRREEKRKRAEREAPRRIIIP